MSPISTMFSTFVEIVAMKVFHLPCYEASKLPFHLGLCLLNRVVPRQAWSPEELELEAWLGAWLGTWLGTWSGASLGFWSGAWSVAWLWVWNGAF